ncbi:polymorphic toxin type 15 domain-containing protein [Agromyces albus]|uniref:Novel toxin 15 domain-containing protein n=1 Tax=Agromyces albus TaxID=205332 RepID=A0A4V1QXK1_9MICO|nr:polymorphic toxin type 15 domain-containing protein [Agromyces albus]RXZ69936.1 hypothetical protein ESP51_10950 [Agromyces albus]
MANVKLDPARLVQDGEDLYSIAKSLDSAVSTLQSRLNSSGGMAGDDNAAEEFCEGSEGYDALAGPTIDGVASFGNALRILDAALSNTARAYDGAQKVGAGIDPASASPAEATATIDESKASVPSALGAGWPGALGEFQELIEWGLSQIGVVIPTGDEDKLQAASEAWGTFGDSIQSARSRVTSSMPNVSAMTLPQQDKMLSCRASLAEGLNSMRESADGMQQWIADFRTQLRQMREELGWFLKQMAIEIAAELAIGGLLTVVTAGLGALATAAKVGTTVIRWCWKIAKLIDRLKDFLRGIRGIKGALVRGGLRAAKEGLQAGLASAIATTTVNHMRADEKGYTPQDVGTAFISAFAGGAVASPVSRTLGGSGGPGFGPGARQIAGETGAGAVDGLASSAVESGITGQEFNPISGMVLGALLGGGLTAGGRGINAVRPGNSANSPGVTTTTDAPTPGSGAGSGSNGNGSGTTVDTDSSGIPTPGSGGGSSTTGDGSSVDVSVDAPSTGDGSGAADTSGSSPDVSAPASPDVSAPASPDVSAPAGPDATAPASPDATAPASPDVSAPASPDATAPASPDVSAPASPDVSAPASPDVSAPASPDVSAPASPDATAPASPDVSAPASPDATAPASPDVAAPASPDATAPASPDVAAPASPDATAPALPDVAAPASPDATAPTAPDAGSTSQPEAPVAAAPASSTTTTATDADAPATDAPATEAGTDSETGAPEASDAGDGDDVVSPEDVAAVGGAAAMAGAAAMLGKPSFLPTHTPGGSTPAAPTSPAAPPASGPDGTAPDGSVPDGTNPDAADGTASDGSGEDGTGQDGSGQDGSKDAEKPDTSQNNRSERTLDEIKAALDEINPNYDPSDPANGYATNCGNTSSIMNDFFNGSPTTESPTGTLSTPQMEARTGNPQTPMTPEQIEASLRALGAGSHCVVGIDRSTGDGHWFNAYFDGTNVWVVDAQPGTMSPWPPNEPNATNWDASIPPEHVAPAAPDASSTPAAPDASTTPAAAPDASAPDASAPATPEGTKHSPDPAAAPPSPVHSEATPFAGAPEASAPDGDRSANTRYAGQATVPADHASDGSQKAGTTYNGYQIPELTPEIREQLDEFASRPDSPIIRNDDGSYSLKDPIEVEAFDMSNAKHDWVEFQRQVGLQQQGLNKLSIAEWRHNVNYYLKEGRVAQTLQAAANHALADAGVTMKGQAVLHGPDQVAGGRADRFDGAGSLGENSSFGRQWRDRIDDLRQDVAGAMADVPATLHAHVKLNVHLGATDSVGVSPDATQATLTSALPVTGHPSAPPTRAGVVPQPTVSPFGDAAPDAPAGPAPSGASDGEASSTGSESPEQTAPADDSTGSEGSEGESAPADEDVSEGLGAPDASASSDPHGEAEAEPVPATMHDPILDAAFPRLFDAEAPAVSISTVNAAGWAADAGRFLNNCHFVVNALELRFRGYNVIASPTVLGIASNPATGATNAQYEARIPMQIASDWVQADGTRREFQNLDDVEGESTMKKLERLTESWPEGGRGFIGGFWKMGGGHVFTVVKGADGIEFHDGQTAMVDASAHVHKMNTIKVLRVDDLHPSSEVLKTSKPWTVPEAQLLKDWAANPDIAKKPEMMIDRELAANARWRDRNNELTLELEKILSDPSASLADKQRAWDNKGFLQAQNLRLAGGAGYIEQAVKPKPPVLPSGPSAQPPAPPEPFTSAGAAVHDVTVGHDNTTGLGETWA